MLTSPGVVGGYWSGGAVGVWDGSSAAVAAGMFGLASCGGCEVLLGMMSVVRFG